MSRVDDRNQAYATLLGWTPRDFNASGFDDQLAAEVLAVQTRHGLDRDGICGPDTYRAFLDDVFARRKSELASGAPGRLRLAGELAVNRAKWMWLDNVIDPPDASERYANARARIDGFIRGPEGLGWSWEQPYVKDGDFEWCGAFLSWAWGQVGLTAAWRRTFISSTYRIDRFGQYLAIDANQNPPPANAADRRRYLQLDGDSSALHVEFDPMPGAGPSDPERAPRAGDILLVGKRDYGSHITMVERYDLATGCFITIEGNGVGSDPKGVGMEGVVRGKRRVGLPHDGGAPVTHARRLVRPSVLDLA